MKKILKATLVAGSSLVALGIVGAVIKAIVEETKDKKEDDLFKDDRGFGEFGSDPFKRGFGPDEDFVDFEHVEPLCCRHCGSCNVKDKFNDEKEAGYPIFK